ncbi:MAG: FprA family A-type flavoprotein [Candidatus Bathyarchaeota archaeon]|nr:FprA family A-type flavoprotein [Candidatus Bathyarchaeota archaeon]
MANVLTKIKEGIYWVGAVDWAIRNFHGYITRRGSSYNSYLVIDEKVCLIDFVKAPFADDQLAHIEEIIDPARIDYIVANHAEPDHSGSIRKIIEACPNAQVIATARSIQIFKKYYGEDLKITPIEEVPTLNLGRRSLTFVPVPMAHWPDSMVSYMPEEKLLFSNDAFGQHLASSGRFDDEVDKSVLMEEATTYYANILMPLWRSIKSALKSLEGVPVEMIAPSHGVIWRSNPGLILDRYVKWVNGETKQKAVVVYDTMWGSTEKLARALTEGLTDGGVEVKLMNLSSNHNSDVIAEVLDAKAVFVGSPTLNNWLFPSVAGFLAYMHGLKPLNKIGAAFGSYGWAGGAKKAAEAEMTAAGISVIDSGLDCQFKPTESEIRKAFDFGREIALKIKT